jgi:hypothetical protein
VRGDPQLRTDGRPTDALLLRDRVNGAARDAVQESREPPLPFGTGIGVDGAEDRVPDVGAAGECQLQPPTGQQIGCSGRLGEQDRLLKPRRNNSTAERDSRRVLTRGSEERQRR